MLSAADIVRLDAQAVRASVGVVSLVGRAELARPTPCGDWTLADLLAHMTAQHNGFAAAAAGHGADLVRWQTGAPAADPVPEYAAAAAGVLAAFGAPGVLDREFAVPEISPAAAVPGRAGDRLPLRGLRGARVGRRAGARRGLRT